MKRTSTVLLICLGGSMFLVAGGCEPTPIEPMRVSSVGSDLVRGSTGPEVEALNNYLKTYGYFPNDDLQNRYPAWRPIVSSGPSDLNVFDANVEAAVIAFQKNMGLRQTGVLDAGTRVVMAQLRCGVPDGIPRLDPSDKFAIQPYTALGDTTPVVWLFAETGVDGPGAIGLSAASVQSDIQYDLNQWHSYSAYSFQQVQLGSQVNSSNNIDIGFYPIGNSDGVGTWANTEGTVEDATTDGASLNINSDPGPLGGSCNYPTWTDAPGGPPAGSCQLDLPSILLHELGHALGMAHSSIPGSVMYGSINPGQTNRYLTGDDVVGIAAINPTWTNLGQPPGGPVQRVALNSHFNGPSIWALAGATAGGYGIWEQDGGWFQHPGGAVRIAVNTASNANQPWVINNQNQVFRWNWNIQNWDNIPACATDIGIGTDDSVWVIGCNSVGTGADYGIYKYNGDASCFPSNNCWTESDGGATKISVGQRSPTDATVVPWVINSVGQYFRRTSSDPTVSGAWETLPAEQGMPTNTSIAACAGYAYTTGWSNSYPYPPVLFSWDEQPTGGGHPPAAAERSWVMLPGQVPESWNPITIAPAGYFPIVATTQGDIYMMN
jgi:peptidoglycan hydrolase-like protein with peptidoglycan-binding domain